MTRQISPLYRHMLRLVTCKCVNILICQMWTSGVTLTEHTTPQPQVRSLYELSNRSALYMDTGSSNNKYTVYYRSSQCCFKSKRYFQRIKKKYFCQVDTYFSFERMGMPYTIFRRLMVTFWLRKELKKCKSLFVCLSGVKCSRALNINISLLGQSP